MDKEMRLITRYEAVSGNPFAQPVDFELPFSVKLFFIPISGLLKVHFDTQEGLNVLVVIRGKTLRVQYNPANGFLKASIL